MNLERAGDAKVLDRALIRPETFERVQSALDQPRRQEIIPPARNDREPESPGVQASLMCDRLQSLSDGSDSFGN